MSVNSVSSQSLTEAPRAAIERSRKSLVDAQLEVSTGRHADVGLILGFSIGDDLNARGQIADLSGIVQSSALVSGRLDVSQSALGSIVSDANTFTGFIVAARSSNVGQQTVVGQAKGFLRTFRNLSNSSQNGVYVFAGQNSDKAPIADYFATPSSIVRTAVQDAFKGFFGFSSTDPAVSKISAQQISDFVNGPFDAIFSTSSWSGFSSASNTNLKDRISSTEVVESSTNANDQSFRNVAKAYVMMSDLGTSNLNQGAFSVLADKATLALASGIQGAGVIQSNLGFVQERITAANGVSNTAIGLLQKQVDASETVDPYAAATNLNSLSTQLEAAYSISAKMQKLSILNYV